MVSLVERMLEHFCPEDPEWRRQVLLQARHANGQAMEGLLS